MSDKLYPAVWVTDYDGEGYGMLECGTKPFEMFMIDTEVGDLTFGKEQWGDLLAKAINDAHDLRVELAWWVNEEREAMMHIALSVRPEGEAGFHADYERARALLKGGE